MKIKNIYITVVLVLVPLLLTTLANAATRTIHAEWNPVSMTDLAGFRLYQENSLACEINDPGTTSIDCDVTIGAEEETWYTLTYFLIDGTESAHSAPIPYTFTSSPLVASVSADIVTGIAPLDVLFDATASTGDIVSYQWMFGDGGTASGLTPTHTFSTEGSYVVTLTVSDGSSFAEDTLTVNVSADMSTNTPPTATISSSSGIGEAPFQVTLDAGNSSDSDGQIISYLWDLGDGTSAEGAQVSHTYTTAGTYNPTVTVTDDGGLTDTASTPIIVESSSSTNTPPTANITASVAGGPPPLNVSFDAGSSSDADGSIVSYYWDFGDGSTGNGKTIDHTFEQSGTYTIELVVTDDDGYISQPATLQVIVDEDYQANSADIIQIINLLLLD